MTVHPVFLRSIAALLLLLSVLAGSRIASAADAPDFTLLDEQGQAVKLHYHRLADAIVLMSHRNDSEVAGPAARIAAAAIAGLPDRQIPFFLINADAGQTRSAVLDAKREQSLSVPVLIDDTGLVSQTLAFTYTGEVLSSIRAPGRSFTAVPFPKRWKSLVKIL